jgi:hypothetical protein
MGALLVACSAPEAPLVASDVEITRPMPGRERTQIPDDEIWEVNLEAKDGSHYEVDSRKLKAAD